MWIILSWVKYISTVKWAPAEGPDFYTGTSLTLKSESFPGMFYLYHEKKKKLHEMDESMFYDFCELIVLAHIFPRLPFHVGTQNCFVEDYFCVCEIFQNCTIVFTLLLQSNILY